MSAPVSAICVRLTDRLGNQMFQYAAGRALAARVGLPLLLDRRVVAGVPGIECFDLPSRTASRAEIATLQFAPERRWQRRLRRLLRRPRKVAATLVREPHFTYWAGLEHHAGPALLWGFWQSARYFEGSADAVREDFRFPALPSGPAAALARMIGDRPASVAIHVRRGDYVHDAVGSRNHGGCCEPDYYQRAIDAVAAKFGQLNLFVFSDDPRWVRENFAPVGHDLHVADVCGPDTPPHVDMHLMSLARAQVIANSSYSWWAAWLNPCPDKVVVAPARWFRHDTEGRAAASVIPPDWMRL